MAAKTACANATTAGNCADQINRIMSGITYDDSGMPYPALFCTAHCTNQLWPPPGDDEYNIALLQSGVKQTFQALVESATPTPTPAPSPTPTPAPCTGNETLSILVPENWKVRIDRGGQKLLEVNGPYIMTNNCALYSVESSSNDPWFLITDEVTFTLLADPTTYRVRSCLGVPVYFYSVLYQQPAFKPQSERCDAFMQTFYTEGSTLTPPDAELQARAVACFKGQETLNDRFPDLTVPVICFDAACRYGGYATAEMIRDECTAPVCQKYLSGPDGKVVIDPGTTIQCGDRTWTLEQIDAIENELDATATPTPVKPPDVTPGLNWLEGGIIIGVAILVAVALGIVIYFYA